MVELIHSTETGFVKGRSIRDNIFTFCEASTLARLRGEDLPNLLLDFKKAYDSRLGILGGYYASYGIYSTMHQRSGSHVLLDT